MKPVLLATAADVNTEQLLAFDKIIVTTTHLPSWQKGSTHERTLRLIQTVQLTEKASLLSEKLNKYVFG